MNIDAILAAAAPVMPVLTIRDASTAPALADALAAGGLRVLEITLRSADAVEAIEAVRSSRPDLVVGAGTVLSATQMRAVADAGAQFAVSPGFTPALAQSAVQAGLPYLPGVVTAGEIQSALERGLGALKFFPAAAAGGATLLANYASVFPDVRFCPTGGIGPDNMCDYLALPNVACIGGSWLAPSRLIDSRDWAAITQRVTAALQAAGPATE